MVRIAGAGLALIVLWAQASVAGQDAPHWPDTYVSRLEALALLQTLNADILGSSSATATLETWCRDHRLATEPRIVAQLVAAGSKPPTGEQRSRLEVGEADEVKYRKVDLRCGARVLSQAETWYVPDRLTPDMNRTLESTDTPFGRVVAPVEPYRRTFSVAPLWRPLAVGWERDASPPPKSQSGTLDMPQALFAHRAVLFTRDHRPIAEVHEVYQRQLLAFTPRARK